MKPSKQRKPTNKQVVEAFRTIAKGGIAFSVNLIIGFPGETRNLVMETVELVKQIYSSFLNNI